jgi:hypothetical protein
MPLPKGRPRGGSGTKKYIIPPCPAVPRRGPEAGNLLVIKCSGKTRVNKESAFKTVIITAFRKYEKLIHIHAHSGETGHYNPPL